MKLHQSAKAVLFSIFLATFVLQAQTDDIKAEREHRVAWFREARFGMFIHWGPASLTGEEISWSRANSNTNCPNEGATPVAVYDNLYKNFNPVDFKAEEWVKLAKKAGMKYMVLTAKHGDGFLLWKSKVDPYNIGATPFERDVCAEFASAARKGGMKVGWYFSPMDWRDPDCRSINNDRFVKKDQAEICELLSKYGRIDLMWFDMDFKPAMWRPEETSKLVRDLQPKILINNRLRIGSYEEWLHQAPLRADEDFQTPEQRVGGYNDQDPWETCMTVGTQWAWRPGDKMKSSKEIIRSLVSCVGGDGNLLLNVGPMPNGLIEPRQVELLEEVGKWMEKHGESIYGTRGGPWKPGRGIASTRKGDTIYLHVLSSAGEQIELPDLPKTIKGATLWNGQKVKIEQKSGKLTFDLGNAGHDRVDTIIRLRLSGSAMEVPSMDLGK